MTLSDFFKRYLITSDRQDAHQDDTPWPIEHNPNDYLWRFIRFDQLIDILSNKQMWFSVPSELGHLDPLDGMPDSDLTDEDMRRSFPQIQCNNPKDWEFARRLVRNSVNISCWTCAGETYAMWKAYGDLEWGICLRMTYAQAITWADEEKLDRGPVIYLQTARQPGDNQKRVDLHTPISTYEILGGPFNLEKPFPAAPLQWFKSAFFHTEFEYRFGKRKEREVLLEAWCRRSTYEFRPTSVPFDADVRLDGGAIITGPRAPKWYTQFVQKTVEKLAPCVQVKPSDGVSWCEEWEG